MKQIRNYNSDLYLNNRSPIDRENFSDSISYSPKNRRNIGNITKNHQKQYAADQSEFLDDITNYSNISTIDNESLTKFNNVNGSVHTKHVYVEDESHKFDKLGAKNNENSFKNMKSSNTNFHTNSTHETKTNSSFYDTRTSNHSKNNKTRNDPETSHESRKGIPTNSEMRWLNKELNM